MSSRHRTPAEIAIIVSQFHASGLSRRDFARRHDFSVGSLARWLQRQPTTPNSPKFVRVVPAAAPTPPSWFELALAWFDPSKAVLPVDQVFPAGQTTEQRNQESAVMMVAPCCRGSTMPSASRPIHKTK